MNLSSSRKRTAYDGIDVMKFVMSVVVVAIHSGLGGGWQKSPIYPYARMAVPFFFMATAYFFFMDFASKTKQQKSDKVRRFVLRNAQLYFFWLIVLLIPTIVLRGYFKNGALEGLRLVVNGLFFGSTFVASWYITASVIGVLLITRFDRFFSSKTILLFTVPCYLIACLSSTYRLLFLRLAPSFQHVFEVAFKYFGLPYNNFVVAVFWIAIGKLISENSATLRERYNNRVRMLLWVSFIVGIVLLYFESKVTLSRGYSHANDCYILLPLPCIALFILILFSGIKTNHALIYRTTSTITYCFHGTFIRYTNLILGNMGYAIPHMFLLTLFVSWALSFLIIHLEKMPRFAFLKYSH